MPPERQRYRYVGPGMMSAEDAIAEAARVNRIAGVLPPVDEAKALPPGRRRRDSTIDDVFLLARIVRGALFGVHDPPARATAAARALTLVLDGAAPAGRHLPRSR